MRRQYGEGSITEYSTKSGRRYEARWREPAHLGSDDMVRRSKGGFTTKKEAAAFIRKRLTHVDEGKATTLGPTDTLTQYLTQWLSAHRAGPSTMSGYRRVARLYVLPHIGKTQISKITPTLLANLYRRLETSGSQKKGPLSPTTVLKAHQLLSVSLADAVEQGVIPFNPCDRKSAKPPTPSEVKHSRKPMRIWNPEELTAFLDWAKETHPTWHLTWLLISHTGARRSEALGLRRADIAGTKVTFTRAVVAVKNKGEKTQYITKMLKNEETKVVTLPAWVAQEIAEAPKDSKGPSDPIVVKANGTQPTPDYVTEVWIKHCREFTDANPDIPYINLHGLRHTHATHLLAAGANPKTVQQRLGHKAFAVTMDLYSHVLEDADADAVDLLDRLYRREGKDG